LLIATMALAVAGCGDKKDKPASQTAAKVNKQEITVHQINFLLQQQRGLPPEAAASAGRQVLDRLIDQELEIQKAQELKLDRDPRVMQQLEAARREIIARSYVEKMTSEAPTPSPDEVKAYYDAHPALFKDRRLYNLQDLNIQARADQLPAIQLKLAAAKDFAEFVNFLKSSDFKVSSNQAIRNAEQLPLATLDKFAQMKDGQTIFQVTPTGAHVILLAGSQKQPVDEVEARPAIERFLVNERKRKMVEDDLKNLRVAAKVEYVGDYAKTAASTPVVEAMGGAPAASSPDGLGKDAKVLN
jgi:EpsD family peptidyl-prolyl cis-trans isomerase